MGFRTSFLGGWLIVGVVLLGCAGAKLDPITVSAETAALVGEHAVLTNSQYVLLCSDGTIPQTRCMAWAKWFTAFKREYGLAHSAYQTAVAGGDITSYQDAANRIQALSNQLVLYAIAGR